MLLQTRLLLFVLHRLHLCIFVILCIQNTNRVSSVIVRWIWLLYCLYELWLYRLWYKCPNISYLVCKIHLKHYLPESHGFRKFFNYSQISKRKKTVQSLSAIDMYLTTAYQSYSYIVMNECNEIPDLSLQF